MAYYGLLCHWSGIWNLGTYTDCKKYGILEYILVTLLITVFTMPVTSNIWIEIWECASLSGIKFSGPLKEDLKFL
jgi:hypothetical protein